MIKQFILTLPVGYFEFYYKKYSKKEEQTEKSRERPNFIMKFRGRKLKKAKRLLTKLG